MSCELINIEKRFIYFTVLSLFLLESQLSLVEINLKNSLISKFWKSVFLLFKNLTDGLLSSCFALFTALHINFFFLFRAFIINLKTSYKL